MAHRFLFLCSRKLNFARIYRSILIFFCGIFLGAAANLFDLYTTNLGNVFSQTSIWIFLCTAISVYSSSPKRAAVNVFFFCTAMLFSYYRSAVISHRSFFPLHRLRLAALCRFYSFVGILCLACRKKRSPFQINDIYPFVYRAGNFDYPI